MNIKIDIIEAAVRKGIDPYVDPFKPSDLDLIASDYGSFSDYCAPEETASGKWNKEEILMVVERDRSGKPKTYLLKR